MSDRTSTIALIAQDLYRLQHRGEESGMKGAVAEAIELYQLTEQMVTEAYKTTTSDPRD